MTTSSAPFAGKWRPAIRLCRPTDKFIHIYFFFTPTPIMALFCFCNVLANYLKISILNISPEETWVAE